MHVSRAALLNQPIYVMRGIYSNPTNPQILMLQNGVPMTTLYSGDKGNAWGGLALENIARIEIIRGPGSALYGADAFTGVINIITKTSRRHRWHAGRGACWLLQQPRRLDSAWWQARAFPAGCQPARWQNRRAGRNHSERYPKQPRPVVWQLGLLRAGPGAARQRHD
jgi:hypothetical protein